LPFAADLPELAEVVMLEIDGGLEMAGMSYKIW
jgi:hypothetical protein